MTNRVRTLITTERGLTLHRVPNRSCVWMRVGSPNHPVATARRYIVARKVSWLLRVPGHQWPVTPDMAIARTVPNAKVVPVKLFRTWQECDHEVARLLEDRK